MGEIKVTLKSMNSPNQQTCDATSLCIILGAVAVIAGITAASLISENAENPRLKHRT